MLLMTYKLSPRYLPDGVSTLDVTLDRSTSLSQLNTIS